MSRQDLLDFVKQVEANLEIDELERMIHDCVRITREGDILDEGYIKHAFLCSQHMEKLYDQLETYG